MELRHGFLLVALGVPWLVVFWRFAVAQRRAVAWIEARSAPRFRVRLTRYRSRRAAAGTEASRRQGGRGLPLGPHLAALFLLGALLVVAAAGPETPGEARQAATGGRLVILLDASASMASEDPGLPGAGGDHRFARARGLALRLVDELVGAGAEGAGEGWEVAVATFSGVVTYQLPFTADRALAAQALSLAELHTFYRHSGSGFAAALDAALHFAGTAPGVQVVVLSDGEAARPGDGDFDAPLAALAESWVPVHAVADGSETGETRVIWDFRDVAAGRPPEERRELVTYETRREERHLRRMAEATGGFFAADRAGVETALADELRRRLRRGEVGRRSVEDVAARHDLAPWLVGLFGLLFVLEVALCDRPRPPRGPAFDLDRLGETGRAGALLLVLALAAGLAACGDEAPAGGLEAAHRENEAGIALDRRGRHDEATTHYRRAIGHGVRPEVPTHNLARSRTLAGDWSAARDLYQEALELDPRLEHAAYNDGVALWRWGEAERDPAGCQLDRTRDLWRAAGRRFAAVAAGDGELAADSRDDAEHVTRALAAVEALIAEPPPECRTPPPQADEDEGRQGGGGAGEGGEDDGGDQAGGLSPEDREELRQALERIGERRDGEGKFFRRSGPEQFPGEAWKEPDDEIWW